MAADTRSRIRAIVVQFPGLHLREVARQLGISLALLQYHLPALLEKQQVQLINDEGTQRLFPPSMVGNRRGLSALRDKHRLHIVLRLLENAPLRHAQLVEATSMGKSTLSFHLRRLEGAGLLINAEDGYRLVDPEGTQQLLEKHRPTPDLVDRFAKVWGDLYG